MSIFRFEKKSKNRLVKASKVKMQNAFGLVEKLDLDWI